MSAPCRHGFTYCKLCRKVITPIYHAVAEPPAPKPRKKRQVLLMPGRAWATPPGVRIYREYAAATSRRGLHFELSIQRFFWLRDQPCIFCGRAGGGIDRLDNDRGYTFDNSVPACWQCNRAKFTGSVGSLVDFAAAIATHTPNYEALAERWESLRMTGPDTDD